MDWKNQLTKTPYLVLFIVLITIGVGTASALITITLAGDVIVTGDIDVGGTITGVETLEGLNCTTDQLAKFDGDNWACVKLTVLNNMLSTVDSIDNVGEHTSIAIGTDNLPVISYYDSTNDDLKVVHCGNKLCNSGNTITTVDSTDDVGLFTSIEIGLDNNPVISYWDQTNNDLKVVHCGNASCSSGNTITIVDSADDVGEYTSIEIGSDNNPVISYWDETNDDLKVVHCGNASCSSGNTITTVDSSADDVGSYTSITIGSDNNPVISYRDETNDDLKVVHCGNASCSSGNTITIVDSADDVGLFTSIEIGSDNNPVISYRDNTNSGLKVVHCGNKLCNSGNTITTVDSTDNVGFFASIAIGTDNNPVISYYDVTNTALKVVHCGNASCSSGNTITTVDSTGFVGRYISIAIPRDSNPVISYRDDSLGDLKVAVEGIIVILE